MSTGMASASGICRVAVGEAHARVRRRGADGALERRAVQEHEAREVQLHASHRIAPAGRRDLLPPCPLGARRAPPRIPHDVVDRVPGARRRISSHADGHAKGAHERALLAHLEPICRHVQAQCEHAVRPLDRGRPLPQSTAHVGRRRRQHERARAEDRERAERDAPSAQSPVASARAPLVTRHAADPRATGARTRGANPRRAASSLRCRSSARSPRTSAPRRRTARV